MGVFKFKQEKGPEKKGTESPEPELDSDVTRLINTEKFYAEWSGHRISDLKLFQKITVAERGDKPIVYLAGDSSLDNKYWVSKTIEDLGVAAPSIYEKTLDKPVPKPDVAFWLNHLLGDRATCINTSIEESMLRERDAKLLPQDQFIHDNIRPQDVMVVSIGANDVALKPNAATMWNMFQLAWLTKREALESHDAKALQYFKYLFGDKIQAYVTRVTAKTKPRAVIVCMIYFPLEANLGQKGWAEWQLKALGYNWYPGQLQTGIRAMYDMATKPMMVEGTEMVPCALHEVLDGKRAAEYTERVEPNDEGGRKMATRFMELLVDLWKVDDTSTQKTAA